jgi:hypothetical protein
MNASTKHGGVNYAARAIDGRAERRSVSMAGHILLAGGITHDILVTDLSYEGCGIETAAPLEPGQALKLSVLRRGALDAEVRWVKDGKAGLGFPVKTDEPPQPRKSERVSVTAEVWLRRMGKGAYQCRVFDFSPDGCKAEMIERPRVGERAVIRFAGMEPLESEVRWVEGPNAGLKFERSFHPAVFDLLLARLG